jgi:putative sterol carrier protein
MVTTIQEFFEALPSKADTSKLTGMIATFQFVATGDNGGEYYVKIADDKLEVFPGKADSPMIVLIASADNWVALMNGQLNGQTAFITGKLKVQGDMTLAMKLESLFQLG